MQRLITCTGFVLVLFTACREKYEPDIISSDQSYLVVEGILNAGAGSTSIRLSRSFKLDDTARLEWVSGAKVEVEEENGPKQILQMQEPGIYRIAALNMNAGSRYRLLITTTDGSGYQSDFVQPKQAPPVDSIGWTRTAEGLQIYANAFDPTGNTQYYLWDFGETYEIHSTYYSNYIFDEDDHYVRERRMPQEEVFFCWKYDSSHRIIINTSVNLQEDRMYQAPIEFIGNGDERLAVRYCMLLRQYAVSKEAYEYLNLMRSNTENLGSVFGPMPSEARGNIRCVSRPEEPVIGFVMASTIAEKRQFISSNEIGGWPFGMNCPTDTVLLRDAVLRFEGGGVMPYEYLEIDGGAVYLSSYPFCVDCTRRGGALQKPSFW